MDVEHLSDLALKQVCRSLGFSTKNTSRKDLLKVLQQTILVSSRKAKHHEYIKKRLAKSSSTLTPTRTKKQKREMTIAKNPLCQKKICIVKIQRWWKKRYRRFHFVNDHDFITLDNIDVSPFILVEETGHVYQFHPHTLAKYFVQEGNFVNPFNRKPLNVIELKRLDRMVKTYDPDFICLAEEQRRITLARIEEKEHVRVCQVLHEDSVQIVGHILRICRQLPRIPLHRVLFQLNQIIFPQYFHTFRQLYLLDYRVACESVTHIIALLQHVWNDPLIASTKESCFVIESTLNTLITFMTVILPSLPIFLPDMLHSRALNDHVPIR